MWKVVVVFTMVQHYSVLESPAKLPTLEQCHYEIGNLMKAMIHAKAHIAFRCEKVGEPK